MNASQSSERALAPPAPLCPPWCEHEHLGVADDPCGFHHDGAVTAVGLEFPSGPGRGDYLFVNVSQVEQHGELGRAFVEVQDERRTIALLTPAECVQLAHALLDGARQLRNER
ncbi:DUF6907 domain-containing protein [Nocardioides marmoribigeumensis]|jgi:hypothetical protein|uniref:Uncharacterized protein n=1 Tax=Nocardioides marmoribigeumensis TaxID=433649 RepID=A0ABU2BY10_9ACTN|nr:hypothetical protein [Nocardioides marmoribigeumensis]MDR7363280.1 hypothetical protein [Nocardioides marmoribigeumensis]